MADAPAQRAMIGMPGTSSFAMWVAMMVAMMLPSAAPDLWRYRQASLGYLFVWTILAIALFPLSAALAHTGPIVSGTVVLLAGALQFTPWKTRQLARVHAPPADAVTPWRLGLRLGLHSAQCCVGLMSIPLVLGMMDLRLMALITAAITAERLAPPVARATGTLAIAAGLFLIARSA